MHHLCAHYTGQNPPTGVQLVLVLSRASVSVPTHNTCTHTRSRSAYKENHRARASPCVPVVCPAPGGAWNPCRFGHIHSIKQVMLRWQRKEARALTMRPRLQAVCSRVCDQLSSASSGAAASGAGASASGAAASGAGIASAITRAGSTLTAGSSGSASSLTPLGS